jgi:hypothetical protein
MYKGENVAMCSIKRKNLGWWSDSSGKCEALSSNPSKMKKKEGKKEGKEELCD